MLERYYLIIQNRWGDEDGHSYHNDVAKDKLVAELMANYFAMSRGGKYDFQLKSVTLNVEDEKKLRVLHIYNADKENSLFFLCKDTEQSLEVLNTTMSLYHREFFALDDCHVWTEESLSKDVLEDNLYFPNHLSPEALQLAKDKYEGLLRNQVIENE